jgi:hypothetical protein
MATSTGGISETLNSNTSTLHMRMPVGMRPVMNPGRVRAWGWALPVAASPVFASGIGHLRSG